MQIDNEMASDAGSSKQHSDSGAVNLRLGLVRHGQTDWNKQGRFQGSSDIPLNETGRADAAAAAEGLRSGPWTTVYSSTLGRAAETADIIASSLGLTRGPRLLDLNERAYGDAEGLTTDQIEDTWPRVGPAGPPDAAGVTLAGRTIPGVETLESVVARGHRALAEIAASARDGDAIIAVCHGTIIRALISDIVGHTVPNLLNGELRELELRGGTWIAIDAVVDTSTL